MTGTGLVTLGETMAVMAAARPGRWSSQRSLVLSLAGAETNVAIGVCRLGSAATWISRLGDDGFGELIRRELRAEGVQVRAATDPDRPTGLMVKERPSSLRTHVRYYRAGSAASALTEDDIPAEEIAAAAVLHVTGITAALGPGPARAVERAVDIAQGSGTAISLDFNYRSALWDRDHAGATLAKLVPRADVVFAGLDEATLVVDEADPEHMARSLAALGPSQVVIKRGDQGAVSVIEGVVRATPAVPIQVVDPVGAGDAFVAGYLAELMAGAAPAVRLDTAAAAGAFVCTALGDWEALPTRGDLQARQAEDDVQR